MKRLFYNGAQQTKWANILGNFEKQFFYSNLLNLNSTPLTEVTLAPFYSALREQSHPFLTTLRNLTYSKSYWGTLIILLVKTLKLENPHLLKNVEKIAVAAEHFKAVQEFHKSILSTSGDSKGETQDKVTDYGNKLAILGGCWLIIRAQHLLAEINNPQVFGMINIGFRDLLQEEFLRSPNAVDISLPPESDSDGSEHSELTTSAIRGWERKNARCSASLLAQCCQAAVHLSANVGEQLGRHAYKFGENYALAAKAKSELLYFANLSDSHTINELDLTSLPVILYLQNETAMSEKIEKDSENGKFNDYQQLYNEIQRGLSLKLTKDLMKHYLNEAEIHLQKFPNNEAQTTLHNILSSTADVSE